MALEDWSERWSTFRESHPLTPKGMAVGVGIGVVLLATVVWAAVHRSPNNPSAPEGTHWKCQNGHEFVLTSQQLNEELGKHPGEGVRCPKCNAPAEREVKCPHCGNMVVPPPGDRNCPVCKQPLSH